MRLPDTPAVDVRGPLTAQRGRLLALLDSLDDAQWAEPTAAPGWSVRDIALHLLDVDLGWLARSRDHHHAGNVQKAPGHEEFVARLARHNQQWVEAARRLSPRLITGLLAWSGEQVDAYLGTVDLASASSVYWAGDAPLWFDIAREFTERWVHYRQILQAARPNQEPDEDEYLPLVLRTFIWGFPHQYRAEAPPGTAVAIAIPGTGAWTLTRTHTGWSLGEQTAGKADPQPAASLRMTGGAAWRLLTGARYDEREVSLSGDPALAGPLLQVRGIIV